MNAKGKSRNDIIKQNELTKLNKLSEIENKYNLSNCLKSKDYVSIKLGNKKYKRYTLKFGKDEKVDDLIKYFSHYGTIVKHNSTSDYIDDRRYEIFTVDVLEK